MRAGCGAKRVSRDRYLYRRSIYLIQARAPERQDVPDDPIVSELTEELHDGVVGLRAAAVVEAPEDDHVLARETCVSLPASCRTHAADEDLAGLPRGGARLHL